MFQFRLTAAVFAAVLSISAGACAQETTSTAGEPRDMVAAELPGWWRITTFTVTENDESADGASNAPAPRASKDPAPASASNEVPGKPGAAPPAPAEVTVFAARLELTEAIYEPLYALDGTALVRPMMDAGVGLELSGWITVGGAGEATVTFDQAGVEEIGKPLDAFDLPTVVFGTEEADAFLSSRDAARAEGTMRKILGNSGEDL